jgi:type IV pilus assembly protein PilN
MIRINLLAVERERGKRGALIPPGQRVTIAASVIILATCLGIGWTYWDLHVKSVRVDEDIAKGEAETQQLRSVLAQVQKFEARKAQLQQRVTLIEQLRRGQSGPVHILDEISKALPDRVWLVSLGQRDKDFAMDGRTTSLSGVSDFVANLQASPWFKNVEILDSQVDQTPAGPMVRFTLRAPSDNPDAAAPPPAAAGRGAPPAR